MTIISGKMMYIINIKFLEIITIVTKLLVTSRPSLITVTLEDESINKTIIDNSKTITGKLMLLCLAKQIIYTLEKVDHITYKQTYLLHLCSSQYRSQ